MSLVIVDDQIRPILQQSASEITFPFIQLESGTCHTGEKPTDWSIQYTFRYDQPMLLQVSRGSIQAVFVMYRFDYIISRTYF